VQVGRLDWGVDLPIYIFFFYNELDSASQYQMQYQKLQYVNEKPQSKKRNNIGNELIIQKYHKQIINPILEGKNHHKETLILAKSEQCSNHNHKTMATWQIKGN